MFFSHLSLHILSTFSSGVVLGNITEHIELSVAAGDCSTFLTLLLAGGATGLLEPELYLESDGGNPNTGSRTVRTENISFPDVNKVWNQLSKSLSEIHQVDPSSFSSFLSSQCSLLRSNSLSIFDGGEEFSSPKNVPHRNVTLKGSCLDVTSSVHDDSNSMTDTHYHDVTDNSHNCHYGKNAQHRGNHNKQREPNKDDDDGHGDDDNNKKKNENENFEMDNYSGNDDINMKSKSRTKITNRGIRKERYLFSPLSTEMSLSILRNVISLIIESNEEVKKDRENHENINAYRNKGRNENSNSSVPRNDSAKLEESCDPQAAFSKLGNSTVQKMAPFRPTFLWNIFLNLSKIGDKKSSKEPKAVNPTIRILRKLMQNGSAGTVKEIIRILTGTFGHCCGNISLPLSTMKGGDEVSEERKISQSYRCLVALHVCVCVFVCVCACVCSLVVFFTFPISLFYFYLHCMHYFPLFYFSPILCFSVLYLLYSILFSSIIFYFPLFSPILFSYTLLSLTLHHSVVLFYSPVL